uniref:Uncharacterized protein n=1 Tax=Rhizophora mucronata TaxID=61149 RepID=A0A2P2PDG4_RHIMU
MHVVIFELKFSLNYFLYDLFCRCVD